MPRRQPNRPFNHQVYICGVEGCGKACTTRGGLKQHTLRVHQPSHRLYQPFNYAEPEGLPFDYGGFDDIMQAAEDFQDLEGVPCPGARKVTHHPILDGTGPLSSLIVCTNHKTLGRCSM